MHLTPSPTKKSVLASKIQNYNHSPLLKLLQIIKLQEWGNSSKNVNVLVKFLEVVYGYLIL